MEVSTEEKELLGRGFTQETGRLRSIGTYGLKVVVITDGWPSGALVFKALGFSVTTLVINPVLVPLLQCLPLVLLPCPIESLDVQPVLSTSLKDQVLWIQCQNQTTLKEVFVRLEA